MSEHEKATPRPWRWGIVDYSTAVLEGPERNRVCSISPCNSCLLASRNAFRDPLPEWEWGRCTTPSAANARLIVAAVNSYDASRALIEQMLKAINDMAHMIGAPQREQYLNKNAFEQARLAWAFAVEATQKAEKFLEEHQ